MDKYRNSIKALGIYAVISILSIIIVSTLSIGFDSGHEVYISIVMALAYFICGFFLIKPGDNLYYSLLPFCFATIAISTVLFFTGLTTYLLVINMIGIVLMYSISTAIPAWLVYIGSTIFPALLLYLGALQRKIIKDRESNSPYS